MTGNFVGGFQRIASDLKMDRRRFTHVQCCCQNAASVKCKVYVRKLIVQLRSQGFDFFKNVPVPMCQLNKNERIHWTSVGRICGRPVQQDTDVRDQHAADGISLCRFDFLRSQHTVFAPCVPLFCNRINGIRRWVIRGRVTEFLNDDIFNLLDDIACTLKLGTGRSSHIDCKLSGIDRRKQLATCVARHPQRQHKQPRRDSQHQPPGLQGTQQQNAVSVDQPAFGLVGRFDNVRLFFGTLPHEFCGRHRHKENGDQKGCNNGEQYCDRQRCEQILGQP